MSDFKSPFDRDLFRAAELGKRAADIEIRTLSVRIEAGFILNGFTSGSDKIRYEFRKGILDRYKVSAGKDEWERERIAEQRKALHAAYYAQPQIISAINAKLEVTAAFDIPTDIVASDLDIETPEATAEFMNTLATVAVESLMDLASA